MKRLFAGLGLFILASSLQAACSWSELIDVNDDISDAYTFGSTCRGNTLYWEAKCCEGVTIFDLTVNGQSMIGFPISLEEDESDSGSINAVPYSTYQINLTTVFTEESYGSFWINKPGPIMPDCQDWGP